MAHLFMLPIPPEAASYRRAPNRRSSVPATPRADMASPSSPAPLRNHSIASSSSSPSDPGYSTTSSGRSSRNNSSLSAHRNPRIFDAPPPQPPAIRTRSFAGPYGVGAVIYEREPREPSDDDIIIVTVRLSDPFRRGSREGSEDLPMRPPPRSFLHRLTTRLPAALASPLDHSAEREQRYKAVKLPRGDYKRFFRRDRDGNYAGTEPEREWDEESLGREFGEWEGVRIS